MKRNLQEYMDQGTLECALEFLRSGNVLSGNPTPNSMMLPALGVAQEQNDIDCGRVIVGDTNLVSFIKEPFGGGHKALAASYTTSDWNNLSTLGMVQVGRKMVLSTVSDILPGLGSEIASSTIFPYPHFYRPSEAEAKCPITGHSQSYCPLNEQIACHLPQHPVEESQSDSNDLLNQAIQRKVLLAYIQYKESGMFMGDAQVSFVNHMHLEVCNKHTCKCIQFFSLASHYDGCHDTDCNICGLVCYKSVTNNLHPKLEYPQRGLLRDCNGDSGQARWASSETLQPSLKRLKLENPYSPSLPPLLGLPESPASYDSEVMEVNIELLPKLIEDSTGTKEIGKDVADKFPKFTTESNPGPSEAVVCSYNLTVKDVLCSDNDEDIYFRNGSNIAENGIEHSSNLESNTFRSFSEGLAVGCEEGETEAGANSNGVDLAIEKELTAQESNCEKEIKLESQKIRGVSLTENFTAQQIKEHISSLRQHIYQDMQKKERGNRLVNVSSENFCQLCGENKLSLAPAPIYCSSCSGCIRRGAIYYSTPEENDVRRCLCTSCYKAFRGESITFSGIILSRANMGKRKNDEEVEESWVQCDRCEGWQHQICALYNDKNDREGKAQFICPKCCLKEIQNGERMPPLGSTIFGAKDLPRTMLSDHIEQRLFRHLRKEREETARISGKSIDEVPEAEGLVIRVVLSVDKHVKVRKQLLDILHNENYPAEFPYKSKVILLFQKIEGVDVCLFSMYVQEFGSECGQPNQRCVYISYLDSVKYFRPERETTAGEALRTVVYHEILIGYLEYCKKRGFATCYLWACPPMKGEDYILYCHPEVQKTPKSDKLRHWYQSMLQKAAKEKVVVDLTNLYDQFFVSTGQYNSKVTVAHLPYFDGDYWSGAAEDVITNFEEASSQDSKKMNKKIMSKRTLKAMGHTSPSGHATKDILLMQKLGQKILPIKEDFIIAHLHFVCSCCHGAILSGWRWICSLCKSFQLCERCHDVEQNINKECSHTLCNGEKHLLCRIKVDNPSDTDDKDVSMDNGLFENRHSFLSFCQENNYQFDTLRRAKYSSMMILHYLHNPTALTTGTTCSICHKDTLIDQLCEICPNVAVCTACYQRDSCSLHVHKLTRRSSAVNSATKNREVQKKELLKTQMLEVLRHACQCSSRCSYPNCLLIKRLFLHAKECSVKAGGGCRHCKKMWVMLGIHSKYCKEIDCSVPRCRDIKQWHAKFPAQQPEAIRRGCT